jgi:hypothetical protein
MVFNTVLIPAGRYTRRRRVPGHPRFKRGRVGNYKDMKMG